MLQTGASVALIVFVLIFAVISVVLFAVIAIAIKKMELLFQTLVDRCDPVIVKASDTLDTVHRVTSNIGEKADHILTRGEEATNSVAKNVERTANVVQTTVTNPLINLSSLVAGLGKGFTVWGQAQAGHSKANENGTAGKEGN